MTICFYIIVEQNYWCSKMISGSEFKAKVANSLNVYMNQKAEKGGGDNLVVDGNGKGTISTEVDDTVILLADGDDIVFADSDSNYIEAQGGNNKITTQGNNNTILTDNGNNQITSTGNNNDITTKSGNNVIRSTGNENNITTDNGNNQILSVGNNNDITTDRGNNIIGSKGNNNNINAGRGNDQIVSSGNNNTISGGRGNDSIISTGNNNVIDGGAGDDAIQSKGDGNTIKGGSGNNKISSDGDRNNIFAGDGNNQIGSKGDSNTIKVGDGDNKIVSEGDKNNITTGNGDNQISSKGDENTIKTGNGDDYIISQGNRNNIFGGNGNNKVSSQGNSNKITTGNGDDIINSKGNSNVINGGDGDNGVLSIGKNNKITTGNGDDTILSIGDNTTITGGNGDKTLVFDGNNQKITFKDGDHNISTLDYAIMNGQYGEYVDYLNDRVVSRTRSELISSEMTTEEVSRSEKTDITRNTSVTSVTNQMENILSQLSAEEQQLAANINFEEKTKDGQPMYVIGRGSKDGQLHIYKNRSGNTYAAISKNVSTAGDYLLHLNGQSTSVTSTTITNKVTSETVTKTLTVVTQDVLVEKYKDTTESALVGVKNVDINLGNGDNNLLLNVSKNIDIDAGNGKQNYKITGEIVLDESETERTEKTKIGSQKVDSSTSTSTREVGSETEETQGTSSITVADDGSSYTDDPLVIDFNRDGKISVVSGTGVDIDGNGVNDGAATDGDKMLAMSDLNGNGKIDGSEVFGNRTVSPFTGEPLNAKNGFEALKLIAQEAEQYANVKCTDDQGNVDLAKLKDALKSVGVNLGFISDNNVTELEDLAHVASINVNDYVEQQDEDGNAHNKQAGSYTDTDGNKHQAGDFWFKLFGKK